MCEFKFKQVDYLNHVKPWLTSRTEDISIDYGLMSIYVTIRDERCAAMVALKFSKYILPNEFTL